MKFLKWVGSMVALAVEKLIKTEYWMGLMGMAAIASADWLGVPEEHFTAFYSSVTGLVAAYFAQRGIVKMKAGKT
jgi:hypothetical protein